MDKDFYEQGWQFLKSLRKKVFIIKDFDCLQKNSFLKEIFNIIPGLLLIHNFFSVPKIFLLNFGPKILVHNSFY